MPDTMRYPLTAEQAHGLIDVASRWSRHGFLVKCAYTDIDTAETRGCTFWIDLQRYTAILWWTSPSGASRSICNLYPARARKYLEEHGIKEDMPND